MIPPKYRFLIGQASALDLVIGVTITDAGVFVTESGKFASGLNNISENMPYLLFDVAFTNSYNAIFFYDSSEALISYVSLSAYNGKIISVPAEAKYWGIRFTRGDSNFMDVWDKEIMYNLRDVNPHYKDLSKKYAKESGQEFFRISLDGKINLFGQDYEYVANSDLESKLIFMVYKYNRLSKKWSEYYKGEFSKTDCKLDRDKKKCELKLTTLDSYNNIMNAYDSTYDLIKLAPAITPINLHKRSLMQVYVRGANSISNFFGGVYWEGDVNEAIDDHNALINKYYFSYIKAGNEFYVRGAGISDVNGVYAGTNGYWSCWNGYTCYMGTDTPMTDAYIYIARKSDSAILYRSVKQYVFTEAGNCYIGREDIEMVNLNDSTDKFTIESPFVYHIYRRLLCDVDTVEDSEGVKSTYDLPSDDFVTDNRNYKKCIGLKGGLFFCTSRAVDEPTRFGLNDYGQYFTNQFIPSPLGLGKALPISRNSWANASLWYVYDTTYEMFEERLRKQYTLRDSYSIAAVIKALLNKIDPTIKHEETEEYSQFLYGGTCPIITNRFFVYITQKTNILKGDYDQPAQKAEITFEDVMKMLRDCFRCYWYIEDNKFKVEHISFFMNGGSYEYKGGIQLDFTQLTDQFNKQLSSYYQSEVEYEKSDLSSRYEFAWMDDVTDIFGGVTIDVKSNYVQKDKTEEVNISNFSSDVDYMLFNPSNFSDDGFALLCPTKDYYLYKVLDATYIQTDGVVNTGTDKSFKTEVYKVESGKTYRIAGISRGPVSSFAIYKDESLSELVQKYNPHSSSIDVKLDGEFTIPEGGQYLAVPYDVNYPYEERVKIMSSAVLELPIVEAQLIDESGDSYGIIAQNWYASWPYLVRFYMYDMPAGNIDCNVLNDLYVNTVKMCMKHTVEFPIEEDLDELELIKTNIGNGKIDEYSVNMNTRTAKVKLTYSPQ